MNTLENNSNEWKEAKGMSALAIKLLRNSPAGKVALASSLKKESQTPVPQNLASVINKS